MSWPKPIIISEDKLKTPNLKRWFIVLMAILVISALLIFLLKPKQSTSEEIISYLAILIVEIVIWALLFSWRMYSHGLEVDRFESWEQEKQLIDLRWNNWASRHLVVLSSHTMMPEGKSAKAFLAQSQDMAVNSHQAIALEFYQDERLGNRQQQAISEMLFAQFSALSALPVDRKIKVEIFNANNVFNPVKDDFQAAWKQLGIPHKTEVEVRRAADLSAIEHWIDNPDSQIKLLIILQLEDLHSNTAFTASEFACAFLLASEQQVEALELTPRAQVLRPMLSDSDSAHDDLKQMHEVQREMETTHHLWLTGFQGKSESNIVACLSELKLDLRHEQEKSGTYYIDLYHGLPGKLNGWLGLSLAVAAVQQTGETQLAASNINNQIAFNLIQPIQDKQQKEQA
ncbi:hypothetical protein [Pragia fontium]|uniref:Type VI secretion protein n=2 Tax=Pragia fontium TaxID=82985 RepID=A0AAJ4WDT3_9GAMM|nr:hypothetical protein [Pragia fontium]GKX61851.1 hypothetical protein SOASR032_04200 [Pragia fontium]SFD49719.1 hypothetical protein SAMN02745723_1238 [Pragia fontium DSM 5563 = ATCC 49100]